MVDLNSKAVECRSGQDAVDLLGEIMKTPGIEMVHSVHPAAGVQQQPQGTGAGDNLVKPR